MLWCRLSPNSKEVAELILKIHDNGINVGPFSNKIRTWDKVAKDYENAYTNFLQTIENNQMKYVSPKLIT